MTDSLIPFLKDITGRISTFGSLINFIHVKQTEDGRIMARASANDGSIHLHTQSLNEIDFKSARGCFGNLPYLNTMLSAGFINSETPYDLRVMDRNGKSLMTSIQFTPNNRMELVYVGTDPVRASLTQVGEVAIEEWPVLLVLDDPGVREIMEFKKIHAAAPSTGGESTIQLHYNDGNVIFEFGNPDGQTSTLSVDGMIDADSQKPFAVTVLSDHLIRALQQSMGPDKTVTMQLCDRAIRLVVETSMSEHQMIIIGRKKRND